jgi:hypothetical protein
MTAVSIEHHTPSSASTRVAGPLRPEVGSGRRVRPQAHPGRGAPTAYAVGPRNGPRACALPDPAVVPGVQWRLTERGVAVVLVAGLMIMVAALTVVGLTALRVTGPGYRPDIGMLGQSR